MSLLRFPLIIFCAEKCPDYFETDEPLPTYHDVSLQKQQEVLISDTILAHDTAIGMCMHCNYVLFFTVLLLQLYAKNMIFFVLNISG